eukprot:830692-Amphidinium_carterae.1
MPSSRSYLDLSHTEWASAAQFHISEQGLFIALSVFFWGPGSLPSTVYHTATRRGMGIRARKRRKTHNWGPGRNDGNNTSCPVSPHRFAEDWMTLTAQSAAGLAWKPRPRLNCIAWKCTVPGTRATCFAQTDTICALQSRGTPSRWAPIARLGVLKTCQDVASL